jgi:hypothetical protein
VFARLEAKQPAIAAAQYRHTSFIEWMQGNQPITAFRR